jgi:hypothetical protein
MSEMKRSMTTAGMLAATVVSVGAPTSLLRPGEPRAASPVSVSARTVSLNVTGHLHLKSKHGFTLNEQGHVSGTITGTIYVHLTAVSTSRATAEVNIYPGDGSLSASGSASYHRASTTASFSGVMSINRGTGRYSHVRASRLSFRGTIYESKDDAITVHVTGRVSG